ncbi:MAG: fold metallo-hydrolase [Paenibacillaceae bacterium]|jgi:beta-lactamase superfamily II metal-dependent hydrolase|nr:fold metallo-hydrolase [Paenibacillaceae bacterium]
MNIVLDFLNVGFGEATVILLEDDGRRLCYVVDTGDKEPLHPNPRRIQLLRYMQEFGVDRIEGLILTHFHKDHIGGALSVIDHVPVGEIIVHIPLPEQIVTAGLNDYSTPIRASVALYAEMINKARERGIPLRTIEEPYTIRHQEAELKLLTPDRERWMQLRTELGSLDVIRWPSEEEKLTLIDRSLNRVAMAVLIRCRGHAVALLTSDVGPDFWEPYEAEFEHVHLMQAAHHGDVRAITPELLGRWSPQAVIVSADDQGTYGLPHRELESMIRGHSQAELYYTEGQAATHRIIRLEVGDTGKPDLKLIK